MYKGCHLRLDETHYQLACSYGVADKLEKGKRAMINKLLESFYTSEYMAGHSVSGKQAPGQPKESTKPGLPTADVDAIKSKLESSEYLILSRIDLHNAEIDIIDNSFLIFAFCLTDFVKKKWKEWHNLDVEDISVTNGIQAKLQTEHRKVQDQMKRIADSSNAAANRASNSSKD